MADVDDWMAPEHTPATDGANDWITPPAQHQMSVPERVGTGMLDPLYGGGQFVAHTLPDAGTAMIEGMPRSLQTRMGGTPPPAAETADKTVGAREENIARSSPPGTDWARITGEVLSPVNYLPTAASGPVLKGAEMGARAGATQPTSGPDYWQEKGKEILRGAAAGTALGAAGKAVGSMLPRAAGSDPGGFVAPKTADEAKTIASHFYAQADQVGGELPSTFTDSTIDSAGAIKGQPQTGLGKATVGDSALTQLRERLETQRGQPMSLQAAQEFDEGLGDLIDNEWDKGHLSKAGKSLLELQSRFRESLANAGPDDMVGGGAGFDAWKQGQQAWSQAMKMSDLERILTRAELMDNPATGIKSGIRTLLSNPTRVRGYSPEEISALKAAADRGVLGSTLQVLGSRLIPIAQAATGNVLGAVTSHGLSSGMRAGASALQTGRLNKAMDVLGSRVPGVAAAPSPSGASLFRTATPYLAPATEDYFRPAGIAGGAGTGIAQ